MSYASTLSLERTHPARPVGARALATSRKSRSLLKLNLTSTQSACVASSCSHVANPSPVSRQHLTLEVAQCQYQAARRRRHSALGLAAS
jgi:hypothetical protein